MSSNPFQQTHAAPSGRILVVRLSAMGDIIHGMPAIAALRRANPELKIGWLVEERWSELLCARPAERLAPRSEAKPLADWVHTANFSTWRKALLYRRSWHEMRDCLHEVRRVGYDCVLDLQGAIRSALAAGMSGAQVRIGSAEPREAPARLFYTKAVPPRGAHVIEHALSLTTLVAGEHLSFVAPPFPISPAREAWAHELHASQGRKPLAIVNPGAGWGAKCWPAESFGAVASALAGRGMTVLINHGPGEELLAESVRIASGGVAVPLKCSVGELLAIMRRASLFIGGDTGPMHLAAALKVPVVALFGPTRPERNGPYGTQSVVLRNPESVHNTSHTDRPDDGLLAIPPAEVVQAAERLLENGSA